MRSYNSVNLICSLCGKHHYRLWNSIYGFGLSNCCSALLKKHNKRASIQDVHAKLELKELEKEHA